MAYMLQIIALDAVAYHATTQGELASCPNLIKLEKRSDPQDLLLYQTLRSFISINTTTARYKADEIASGLVLRAKAGSDCRLHAR